MEHIRGEGRVDKRLERGVTLFQIRCFALEARTTTRPPP